jgi:copper transport protein
VRRLAALLLLLGLWLAPASGAWAHAGLIGSEPADGVRMAQAPGALVLRFDETVTLLDLRLAGPAGAVPLAAPSVEGSTIHASLPGSLPRGTYLVSYRIISADGHPVGGAIAFGLGTEVERSAALPDSQDAIWVTAAEVLRFVLYLGFAVGAGGALFRALVAPLPGTVPRWLSMAAWLGAAAALLGIGVQGGSMMGAPEIGILLQGAPWLVATASTVFVRNMVVAAGMMLVASTLGARRPRVAVGGAGLAAAGLSLSGHAAVGGLPVQALLVLHALTAAYWIGAFLPLAAVLRRDGLRALPTVRRFARLAIPAVALLLLSGVVQAALHLPGLGALTSTTYGLLILSKATGAALLLGLAALNHRRLTPAMAQGSRGAPLLLRRSIAAEGALAVLILGATALLSMTSPHQGSAHSHHHEHHDATAPRGVTIATEAAGLSATLQADPARMGPNSLRLWLAKADGSPSTASEVWLDLSLPEAGISGIRRRMEPAGSGAFIWAGPELAVPGRWHVRAEILVGDFDQVTIPFDLPLAP